VERASVCDDRDRDHGVITIAPRRSRKDRPV